MKKIFPLVLIMFLSAGFFTGCKKDKGQPPVLPPPESMAIDFSNFVSASKSGEMIPGQKGTQNSNWQYAATVAGVWRLIISTTLAVPVAAFNATVNQTPIFVSTKLWQWSYTVTVSNTTYNARLTGQGANAFAEFLWFEGTSKADGTGGQWILNQDPLSPVTFLQIDWTKTGTTVGTVKYTYVKTGDPFNSSYIAYGLTTDVLNAYYTIHYYNDVKFSDVNIEWNTTTNEGRVQSVDYLGDSNWYCWDSNKVNTVCQ